MDFLHIFRARWRINAAKKLRIVFMCQRPGWSNEASKEDTLGIIEVEDSDEDGVRSGDCLGPEQELIESNTTNRGVKVHT